MTPGISFELGLHFNTANTLACTSSLEVAGDTSVPHSPDHMAIHDIHGRPDRPERPKAIRGPRGCVQNRHDR